MIRKIAGVLAAVGVVAVLPATAATAADADAGRVAAQAAASVTRSAPAPKLDPTCQKTFHARPTSSGAYSDPCAYVSAATTYYTYGIDIKFRWDCTGGCHIAAGWAVLRICRVTNPNTDAITVDANSLNFYTTKVAFMTFAPGGATKTSACDTLTSPQVIMKGCGSNDGRLGGTYPQVVSIMARGRGTLYAIPPSPFPDLTRLPLNDPDGLFDTHESYYWIGRGGKCA